MLDVGRWTLDVGRWTLDVGRWTLDVGRWTLDVGRWTLRGIPNTNLCFIYSEVVHVKRTTSNVQHS